jgi:DNA-directed RNA polymerase subunit beta'
MDHMVIRTGAKKVTARLRRRRSREEIEQYQEGLITNGERYNKVVDIWAGLPKRHQRDDGVIGKETITSETDGKVEAGAELQPDLHHGRLGARGSTSRSVSSPACVA